MAKTGRPLKPINWSEVDKLCGIHCTEEEIADFFEMDIKTLYRACRREHKMSFAQYFRQKKGKGKISLRRAQWTLAHDKSQKGSATMQIWLGKQILGQRDPKDRDTLNVNVGSGISSESPNVTISIPDNGFRNNDPEK